MHHSSVKSNNDNELKGNGVSPGGGGSNDTSVTATGEVVANRLFRHFSSRTDVCIIEHPTAEEAAATQRAEPVDGLDAAVRSHVLGTPSSYRLKGGRIIRGHHRVGVYLEDPSTGTVRFACIDIDGPGHARYVDDPMAVARGICEAFHAAGVTAYAAPSRSGRGVHVYVFFEQPVSADAARRFMLNLIPRDIPLNTGDFADPDKNAGIEVFPKATRSGSSYGYAVYLPCFRSQGQGLSFYRFDGENLVPDAVPESVDGVPAEALEAYADAEPQPDASPSPDAAADEPDTTRETSTPGKNGGHLEEWLRAKALLIPDGVLKQVFSLTGQRSTEGWLEARDPNSPSGDRNPSAGVADGTGQALRGTFKSFRSDQRRLSILEYMVEQGQAEDASDAATKLAETLGVDPPRPVVVTSGQVRDVADRAWKMLRESNTGPDLFFQNEKPVRLLHRGQGNAPLLLDLTNTDNLFKLLCDRADWRAQTGPGARATHPDRNVLRMMTAPPYDSAGFPKLDEVLTAPVFGSSGRIIAAPGYHAEDRAYVVDVGLGDVGVPGEPTAEHVAAARTLLVDELFGDFPFSTQADRAHAVALLLLPFARRLISGCTPLHLIDAPAPGTGKTLLAKLVHIVVLGCPAEPGVLGGSEEEIRKSITAKLPRHPVMLMFDNAANRHVLDSESLAAALTTEVWSDRILGKSESVSIPNRTSWVVTGNNLQLSGELSRRTVWIRINAQVDPPSERGNFRHDPIEEWAARERKALVSACLTLIQAWIKKGAEPCTGVRFGSFETWVRVVGGILATAGIPGLLENRERSQARSDAETDEWRRFVRAWWKKFQNKPVRTTDLDELCAEEGLLESVRCSASETGRKTKLGLALKKNVERVYLDWEIALDVSQNRSSARYYLQSKKQSESETNLPESGEAPTTVPARGNAAPAAELQTVSDPPSEESTAEDPLSVDEVVAGDSFELVG